MATGCTRNRLKGSTHPSGKATTPVRTAALTKTKTTAKKTAAPQSRTKSAFAKLPPTRIIIPDSDLMQLWCRDSMKNAAPRARTRARFSPSRTARQLRHRSASQCLRLLVL
jgi:hypothetical protein